LRSDIAAPPPTSPEKRLTRTEAEALCAAGLQLGAVYEDGRTDVSYFTEARGRQDMASAIRFATDLGQPPGSAIYFTVDYDAPSVDTSGPVLAYFKAIGDSPSPYTIGVYGSGAVCDFHPAAVRVREVRMGGGIAGLAGQQDVRGLERAAVHLDGRVVQFGRRRV